MSNLSDDIVIRIVFVYLLLSISPHIHGYSQKPLLPASSACLPASKNPCLAAGELLEDLDPLSHCQMKYCPCLSETLTNPHVTKKVFIFHHKKYRRDFVHSQLHSCPKGRGKVQGPDNTWPSGRYETRENLLIFAQTDDVIPRHTPHHTHTVDRRRGWFMAPQCVTLSWPSRQSDTPRCTWSKDPVR